MRFLSEFKTTWGHTVYVYENGAGGRTYMTDEVGHDGVIAWDTCLVDKQTLLDCIDYEENI